MIYEIINNETGDRFITHTITNNPLRALNRSGHQLRLGNNPQLNLLENCIDATGKISDNMVDRKRHYIQTLPKVLNYKKRYKKN